MDVTTIATVSEDEGTFVHFKDVAGELLYDVDGDTRTPVGARVAGTYSDRYRKAERRISERNTQRRRRGLEVDGDQIAKNTREMEAACIIEWTFTAGGQPFPITAENWSALVEKQPQWEEQVAVAMYDHARFFTNSSAS